MSRARAATIGAVLLATLLAGAAADQRATTATPPTGGAGGATGAGVLPPPAPNGSAERSEERSGDRAGERAGDRGPDAPPRRRFSVENLTPEQIDEVIEVAEAISPEWGQALRARRAEDPQKLREAIASGGPRLLGLAVLKRHHPELYAIRIEDLRLQNELKALAQQYRAVIERGREGDAALEAQLRQKIGRQVDLDLRARAIELKALDAQLRRMVDELTQETRDRSGRVDRIVEAVKAGEEPKSLVRPGFGGDREGRGPRGSRRSPAPGSGDGHAGSDGGAAAPNGGSASANDRGAPPQPGAPSPAAR